MDAINEEEERVVEEYNEYREQTEEAEDIPAVNAIIVNYSP